MYKFFDVRQSIYKFALRKRHVFQTPNVTRAKPRIIIHSPFKMTTTSCLKKERTDAAAVDSAQRQNRHFRLSRLSRAVFAGFCMKMPSREGGNVTSDSLAQIAPTVIWTRPLRSSGSLKRSPRTVDNTRIWIFINVEQNNNENINLTSLIADGV